jgi:hypothetical protein
MERITEIYVILENRPMMLGELCSSLAEEGINIESIGVFHDSAKIYVKSLTKAVKVLEKKNYTIELRDVLLVDLANKPGALAELTTQLGEEGINIEYCYGTLSRKGETISVIIDVDKVDEAERLLKK